MSMRGVFVPLPQSQSLGPVRKATEILESLQVELLRYNVKHVKVVFVCGNMYHYDYNLSQLQDLVMVFVQLRGY